MRSVLGSVVYSVSPRPDGSRSIFDLTTGVRIWLSKRPPVLKSWTTTASLPSHVERHRTRDAFFLKGALLVASDADVTFLQRR